MSNFRSLLSRLKRLPLKSQLVFIGLAAGLVSGVAAYLYDRTIAFVLSLSSHVELLSHPWRIVGLLIVPALGGLAAGLLTHRYFHEAKGHGVMEVVTAIKENNGHIPGRVAWVKTLASAATLGTGGSTGREGPIVQIGASVGSVLGQWLGVSLNDLKTLAAAGAAGGLAATFSVPLASVFFVMEVVLQNFANEAFPAVVISSVTATVVARVLLGDAAFFTPVNYAWHSPTELAFYALLGFLCAPLGLFYRECVHAFDNGFARLTVVPDWVRPAIGGFLVGALALLLPQVRGTGQETVNGILLGQTVGWTLAALAIGKIIATSLTLGSGGAGGALMPSLFVGAAAGAGFAGAIGQLTGIVLEPGAFALVGMAGVFTAAFEAPFTAIIIAFEITRDYGILMPVMLGCVLAHVFSRRHAAHQ